MTSALRPTWDDATAEWARRVRADREQVERLGEVATASDFYAAVANVFKADPHRTDDAALDTLRGLVVPGETWLDIGAGGGRLSLPLALLAKEVIAVEPSDGMLTVLGEGMAEHGISNIRILRQRWPCEPPPQANVALIANVGNDVEDIGPFIEAMEVSARRLCVIVNWYRSPRAVADSLWQDIYDEPRETLPAIPDYLALLLARGAIFDITLTERSAMSYPGRDEAHAFLRRQLWLQEGSERDRKLGRILSERITERDGRIAVSWDPVTIGIVTWMPGRRFDQ
jgi:SAM-dependent methyltransferase